MSVTGVSNTSTVPSSTQPDSGFRTALQQLTSAISSGDLKGAQSAYATLTNLQQSSGKNASTGPMAQFLSSVGADLSKGDLTTAQSALTTFQKAHGSHHHKPDASDTTDASSADASSTQTTSTNILDISA
jgi:hypothetical protein